jgi:hypothetical protein
VLVHFAHLELIWQVLVLPVERQHQNLVAWAAAITQHCLHVSKAGLRCNSLRVHASTTPTTLNMPAEVMAEMLVPAFVIVGFPRLFPVRVCRALHALLLARLSRRTADCLVTS